MVQHILEVVIDLRFEIEFTKLHDHLKRNEVDDAVLDRMLESQKPNAHESRAESLKALDEAEREGDLAQKSY